MAYQSLYRRYRSGRFDELVGQQHVVTALKNAIAEDRVGHAYLFSGPRGTGKTSTARILGKALNCTDLGDDGEPCCACDSCLAFERGTSYDLQELDAASNNGVDAIRDLISRVALGSPGRTKVYILDEVHMLTPGAENALLKTLEEPPDHVVFVLATTEPHKVVPTIRSRTQHYEFELIPAPQLAEHVRFVADDAGLQVDDEMVDYVVRVGGGSARDTLSALDQVVAAGGIPRDGDTIDAVVEGLAAAEQGQVVAAVGEAMRSGREPRVIGETLLARLRDAFLVSMGAPVDHLSDNQAAAAQRVAARMGPAAITRSLEVIGAALIEMRQAPDPRIDLEVALLRLARPELDTDMSAVLARLERLERGAPPPSPPAQAQPTPDGARSAAAPPAHDAGPVDNESVAAEPAPEPRVEGARPADGARAALARQSQGKGTATHAPSEAPGRGDDAGSAVAPGIARRGTLGAQRGNVAGPPDHGTPPPGGDDAPPAAPLADAVGRAPEPEMPPVTAPGHGTHGEGAPGDAAVAAAPSGSGLTLAALEAAWDEVKTTLPGRAKSRFSGGRFVSVDGPTVVFGLPNAIHRDRCLECAPDVSSAIAAHFGSAVDLQLVVDGNAPAPVARAAEPVHQPTPAESEPEEEVIDLDALTDAAADAAGGIDLLTEAFPGAEIVDDQPRD